MYHNKYWSVKKELMIKTSFLDDRHELPEIYLEPAEHLPWGFFCENSQQLLAAVNQFKKKTTTKPHKNNSIGYFWLCSKNTFGLPYQQKICISEFEKVHQSALNFLKNNGNISILQWFNPLSNVKRYLNATFEHDPSIPLHFILVLEGTESKRNCKINLLRGFIFNYLQFLTSTN